MKIKLSYKIFTVFFLTVVIIVAFMVISLRYFMDRHFTEYVNQVELERLNTLVTVLSQEYQAEQGWNRLKSDRKKWWETIVSALREKDSPKIDPLERQSITDRQDRHVGADRSYPPPYRGYLRIGPRLFLLDAQKNLVAGRPAPEKYILRDITVDGKIVGWLGLRKREAMKTPLEVAFLRQQYFLFYLVGGGILIITALVSFLLARHLLAPVKQLTQGTQALTSRRFETRITVQSKDELGQLAADFNLMAHTLETYEKMRQQWMSDISHELRTPLAVLRGEIEALQDGVRKVTPERLESLHAEIIHVSKIVSDLHELSLAEIGALPSKKEPVNPIRIMEETLKNFETRLGGRQIRVIDDLGSHREVTVLADENRLNQLFSNLLENTVRYADSPGSLKVWQRCRGDRLSLFLEDSGPGVPEDSVDRLFDRFYRVDKSRSRVLGGSGLGLSICRGIMETLGGQIRAENVPDGGLRIEMVFPII